MHRSFTFSGDLNVSTDEERATSDSKREILSKFALLAIEFLTSSTLFSFGVLFCEFVSQHYYHYDEGLWTTVLFIFSWHITDPISGSISECIDDKKRIFFRCSVIFASVLLFVGMMIPSDIVCYGIFGGVCTNFISVQIRHVALEKFNTDVNVFEGHRQIAKAASLFIMPHFMLLLVSNYELYRAKVIFATFLLNIIPLVLLIDYKEMQTKFPLISRYQTLPTRLSAQNTELTVFGNPRFMQNVLESDDNSRNSVSSNEDEEEAADCHVVVTDVNDEISLNPNTVQNYYRNAGVSILPEIPEEEEDDDINVINSKRLSRISMKLEELNRKEELIRKDSVVQVLDINELMKVEETPEKIDRIEYIQNYSDHNDTFIAELKSFNKITSCCCSAYTKYVWSRRLRSVKHFFNDNFFYPLLISLRNLYFYPALVSKLSITLTSAIYITLAPFIALEENSKEHLAFSTGDATFLLTYIAFSWSFFLVTLPLLLNFSPKRIKLVFILGFFITAVSLGALVRRQTNDSLTLSCLFFGFGHGVLNFTETIVFRSCIGVRSWKSVQSTLNVFVSLTVILIYYAIYLNRIKLNVLILYLCNYNILLWVLFSICTYCLICYEKCSCCRSRNQNIDI